MRAGDLSENSDKMALLVLIVLGASLGWLASILGRTEAPRDILRQMALGVAVSVIAGEIANAGTMVGSLSVAGLAAGLIAAATVLALYHAIARRRLRARI